MIKNSLVDLSILDVLSASYVNLSISRINNALRFILLIILLSKKSIKKQIIYYFRSNVHST